MERLDVFMRGFRSGVTKEDSGEGYENPDWVRGRSVGVEAWENAYQREKAYLSRLIPIKGIPKDSLLMALWNEVARQMNRPSMDLEETRKIMREGDDLVLHFGTENPLIKPRGVLYFGYVCLVPLKVDLSSDVLDPGSYDETWGEGTAAKVVQKLKEATNED